MYNRTCDRIYIPYDCITIKLVIYWIEKIIPLCYFFNHFVVYKFLYLLRLFAKKKDSCVQVHDYKFNYCWFCSYSWWQSKFYTFQNVLQWTVITIFATHHYWFLSPYSRHQFIGIFSSTAIRSFSTITTKINLHKNRWTIAYN